MIQHIKLLFILPIFPVRGHGVCSLVNRKTLLEHRSKLRSDALPATTMDSFWDSNPQLAARKSCILTIKPRLLPIKHIKLPLEIRLGIQDMNNGLRMIVIWNGIGNKSLPRKARTHAQPLCVSRSIWISSIMATSTSLFRSVISTVQATCSALALSEK